MASASHLSCSSALLTASSCTCILLLAIAWKSSRLKVKRRRRVTEEAEGGTSAMAKGERLGFRNSGSDKGHFHLRSGRRPYDHAQFVVVFGAEVTLAVISFSKSQESVGVMKPHLDDIMHIFIKMWTYSS